MNICILNFYPGVSNNDAENNDWIIAVVVTVAVLLAVLVAVIVAVIVAVLLIKKYRCKNKGA